MKSAWKLYWKWHWKKKNKISRALFGKDAVIKFSNLAILIFLRRSSFVAWVLEGVVGGGGIVELLIRTGIRRIRLNRLNKESPWSKLVPWKALICLKQRKERTELKTEEWYSADIVRTYIPGDICPHNVRTTSRGIYVFREMLCGHADIVQT